MEVRLQTVPAPGGEPTLRERVRGVRRPTAYDVPLVDRAGPDGDAGTQAVVFVHGNPGPMDDFEPYFDDIAKFSRVVAFDLPGLGRASHQRLPSHGPNEYAAHIERIRRALGLERVHLVMHDLGGIWGLRWAVQNPACVASMTFINTGHLRGYRWHIAARIWQTPILGELVQRLVSDRVVREGIQKENPRPLPKEFLDRIMRYSTPASRRAVLDIYRSMRDTDKLADEVEGLLPSLRCPVMFMAGTEDPYIPVELSESQRDVFPNAEMHRLEGLGHWPFIDDPEGVGALLLPFLRRCRQR